MDNLPSPMMRNEEWDQRFPGLLLFGMFLLSHLDSVMFSSVGDNPSLSLLSLVPAPPLTCIHSWPLDDSIILNDVSKHTLLTFPLVFYKYDRVEEHIDCAPDLTSTSEPTPHFISPANPAAAAGNVTTCAQYLMVINRDALLQQSLLFSSSVWLVVEQLCERCTRYSDRNCSKYVSQRQTPIWVTLGYRIKMCKLSAVQNCLVV